MSFNTYLIRFIRYITLIGLDKYIKINYNYNMSNNLTTTLKNIIHGDVGLHAISSIPTEFTKVEKPETHTRGLVVEHGEHSMHTHTLTPTRGCLIDLYQDRMGESVWHIQNAPAVIVHEEHAPLVVPIGIYRKKIEVEYDPFLKIIKKVQD
jgi:hypothetical protein